MIDDLRSKGYNTSVLPIDSNPEYIADDKTRYLENAKKSGLPTYSALLVSKDVLANNSLYSTVETYGVSENGALSPTSYSDIIKTSGII
jgi:hypothetical protein